MNASAVSLTFLSIGLLLGAARALGELARRFGQPPVVGELAAGVLLGPTVLGSIAPSVSATLFPTVGPVAVVHQGIATLSAALFLLAAGFEVDLASVWRQGKLALSVSAFGMLIPFALGFSTAWLVPTWVGHQPVAPPLVFALFLGTALAISALPVIARTLRDLDVFRSDMGMLIIASAVFQDLLGWCVFAVVLGGIGGEGRMFSPLSTVLLTLAFAALMLGVIRPIVNRALPWIHAYTSWPTGVLAFALSFALLAAAFTEWIGVHAIFGAFMVGVVVGDSKHVRSRTRAIVEDFVASFFAPLFFAGIGLQVSFFAHFDIALVTFVLVVASVGKILGSHLGARLGGMGVRESWAVGFGMNARGAMEIILGLLALQAGVIGERLFVALVFMAIVTSVASGPLMQRALRRHAPRLLVECLSPRAFVPDLGAVEREEAIQRLANAVAGVAGVEGKLVFSKAWEREQLMPTGLGEGVAAPHARIDGLSHPHVALGISRQGVDFDALDGSAAELVFLIVTPVGDDSAQLELLADIARCMGNPGLRRAALEAENGTELIAALRSGPADD